ncbi:DUF1232 domain-containing protein [Capnocytophaga granulosa]|uniref:DUF1232 domain-containing protein n=1 Tax=Capnocytophaga granulosa TaxID=45242 RepID=UPI0023F29673|nr:DUF1232 domain-containing protein [Capnocytophaga granulosa]
MSTENKSHVNEWILAILSIAYLVSPIDIIPDIPIVGWVDDFFIAATGGLNLIQGYAEDNSRSLAKIIKMIKYFIIFVGIIVILLIVLLGTIIVKSFS